ncbi:MAG TPA: cytochrome C oxidase subunit IV family protein [Terriglobales bacterium]|nr:cytochrome C oxidase subunit IV family protein [Terriglobales bacterium]
MSEHISSTRSYWIVFAALMGLMILTAILSRVPMPGELNTLIALTIGAIKATLVLMFFMHLKYESYKLSAVVFVAGFFWLLIFFGLILTDYFGRNVLGVPGH